MTTPASVALGAKARQAPASRSVAPGEPGRGWRRPPPLPVGDGGRAPIRRKGGALAEHLSLRGGPLARPLQTLTRACSQLAAPRSPLGSPPPPPPCPPHHPAMPGLSARRWLLLLLQLLAALGVSRGSQSDQCFQEPTKEAGALNIGQRWGDPSPAATLSIELRKVKSAASFFEFRTYDPEGVIFYGDTSPSTDWFVLGLRRGKLEMQIHNSVVNIRVTLHQQINDGRWHQIMVKNEGDSVVLELDKSDRLTLREVSHAIVDHPFPEMRIGVGGLLIPRKDLLIPMNTAMDGCLRRWNWLNTNATWLEGAALEGEGTKACFASIHRGSFFPGGGLASFLLSGLPTGLSLNNESRSPNESWSLNNQSWSLSVGVSLRAGPQTGTILAVSPSEQAPVLSLKLEETDVVAQLGGKEVLRTPLPGAGCPASDLLLRVTSAELALRLGPHETSEPIQEADFKALQHLWLSGEGHLFIGGLPGQGDPPETPAGSYFRGCLHEIWVQGLTLDLDSAQYRSNAIWAHSCPRNETLSLKNTDDEDTKLGGEEGVTTTLAASTLPS